MSNASFDPAEFAVAMLESYDQLGGWDHPWLLLEILAADDGGFDVRPTPRLAAHPGDGLLGITMPADAVGALLVSEAWQIPSDALPGLMPPAEHPRRIEVRVAEVALRDGSGAIAVKRRGGGIETFNESGGKLYDLLRRTLGLEPVGATVTGAEVFAQGWVNAVSNQIGNGDAVRDVIRQSDPLAVLGSRAIDANGNLVAAGELELVSLELDALEASGDPMAFSIMFPHQAAYAEWLGEEMRRRVLLEHGPSIDDVLATVDALDPDAGALWRSQLAERGWYLAA